MGKWKGIVLLGCVLPLGCAAPAPEAETEIEASTAQSAPPVPSWTFDESMIFPADRSLLRPEDGVALADGRVIVADQEHGLRLIAADGSHRPFGNFAAAGYEHDPPDVVGGPNGVTLEPDGGHVLVSDVFRGGIYRVDVATTAGDSERTPGEGPPPRRSGPLRTYARAPRCCQAS